MQPWDLAKLLLNHCSAPTDVDDIVKVLSDKTQLGSVLGMLEHFRLSSSAQSTFRVQRDPTKTDRAQSSTSSGSQSNGLRKEPTPSKIDSPSDLTTDDILQDLEALFRSEAMTNIQIEQWVKANFSSRYSVGKGSLRNYLHRLVTQDDAIPGNVLLSTARLDLKSDPKVGEDIRFYWDQVNKKS